LHEFQSKKVRGVGDASPLSKKVGRRRPPRPGSTYTPAFGALYSRLRWSTPCEQRELVRPRNSARCFVNCFRITFPADNGHTHVYRLPTEPWEDTKFSRNWPYGAGDKVTRWGKSTNLMLPLILKLTQQAAATNSRSLLITTTLLVSCFLT